MANERQLNILKQGVEVWNDWRGNRLHFIDADLRNANLQGAILDNAFLEQAELESADLSKATLNGANLINAKLSSANLSGAMLNGAVAEWIFLEKADLSNAELNEAYLANAFLVDAHLSNAKLVNTDFSWAVVGATIFSNLDLSEAKGLDTLEHRAPSTLGTDTFARSKGSIPETFLRGCGLRDWEIEQTKLYNPNLSNNEITQIQYRVYELRATQALQISPLFISYSNKDGLFVDKIEKQLNVKGIRFWRDIHDMKSGRMEKQIDRAIRQNPTVLLVLSSNSISSDWVEHEVRTARELEKDIGRDVLCPVALDDSWKDSRWPKRVMEQIMEYNILDFSAWEDDVKFDGMFRKLIDGLQLFYKG